MKVRKKIHPGVLAVFLLAQVLFAAAFQAHPSWAKTAQGNTFRAIYPQAPKSLDPHRFPPDPAAWPIIMAVYGRLMTLEPGTGEIAPALAKTMRVSDDGLTYTFILNEGLAFSDGRPVNSEAALYSFDRLMSTETGKRYFPPLSRFEVVGPYTFRLILKEPWPPFAYALTMPMAALISPGLANKSSDYLEHKSLGSGRYEVYDWRDETIGLKIRDDLISKPDITVALYHFEPDAAKRFEKMAKHDAHLTMEPQMPEGAVLPENLALKRVPTFGIRYLAFNCRRPYTKMKSARQALARILAGAFNEKPLNGPFPPGLFAVNLSRANLGIEGFGAKGPEENALEALLAIGPPAGPLTLAFSKGDPALYADAQKVAQSLGAHKIAVNIVALEGAAGKKIVEEGDYDFFLDTRRPELPSAEMWLARFMDSRSSAAGNSALFKSAEADRLIDEMTVALSGRERQGKIQALAELCLEESPYAFLHQIEEKMAVDRRLEKLTPHPMWPEVWPIDQSSLRPLMVRSGANPQGKLPPREEEAGRETERPEALKAEGPPESGQNPAALGEGRKPETPAAPPDSPAVKAPEQQGPPSPAAAPVPPSFQAPAPEPAPTAAGPAKPGLDAVFEPHLPEAAAPQTPKVKVPPPPAIKPEGN